MPSVFYFIASHQFELNLDLIKSEFINSRNLSLVMLLFLIRQKLFIIIGCSFKNQEVLPGGVVLDAINLVSEANYTK